MASHNDTGKLGEILAQNWATENGYEIRALNWRYGNWEIDMIAVKEKKLHFFEIKTRRNAVFGHPEELVGKHKMKNFISAGAAYIRKYPAFRWVQYNILAITLDRINKPTFFLIEDVYY
jgi:putative endonuclease